MDRVNSFLKDQGLPSIFVYVDHVENSSRNSAPRRPKFCNCSKGNEIRLRIYRNNRTLGVESSMEEIVWRISVFWNRDVGVFTVLSLETRVTQAAVIRPRAPEAVSHCLARLHRVSFCQLARHAARTRAWTICASGVGPA